MQDPITTRFSQSKGTSLRWLPANARVPDKHTQASSRRTPNELKGEQKCHPFVSREDCSALRHELN